MDLASPHFPRNSIHCISEHDFKLKPGVLKEKRFPNTLNSDGPIQLQNSSIMLCVLCTGLVEESVLETGDRRTEIPKQQFVQRQTANIKRNFKVTSQLDIFSFFAA